MTVPTRAEAIAWALEEANDPVEPGNVFVCHGPPKCDTDHGNEFQPCPWCHTIPVHDKRTVEQIEADIMREKKGH